MLQYQEFFSYVVIKIKPSWKIVCIVIQKINALLSSLIITSCHCCWLHIKYILIIKFYYYRNWSRKRNIYYVFSPDILINTNSSCIKEALLQVMTCYFNFNIEYPKEASQTMDSLFIFIIQRFILKSFSDYPRGVKKMSVIDFKSFKSFKYIKWTLKHF